MTKKLLILLACVAAFGQTTATLITGTLSDSTGTPFSGTLFISWPDHVDNDGNAVKAKAGQTKTLVASGGVRVSLPPSALSDPKNSWQYDVFGVNVVNSASYSANWLVPVSSVAVAVGSLSAPALVTQTQLDGSFNQDLIAAANGGPLFYPAATVKDAAALAAALAPRVAYWAVQMSPVARGSTRFTPPASSMAFGDTFNVLAPSSMGFPNCFAGRLFYNLRVDGAYPWSVPQGGYPSCGNAQAVIGGTGSSYAAGQTYQLNPTYMLSNPDLIDQLAKQMAYGYLDNIMLGLYAQFTANSPVGLPGQTLTQATIGAAYQALGVQALGSVLVSHTLGGNGTVSLTSGTGAVVGVGTSFNSSMIGYSMTLQTGTNTGINTTISTVTDATHLTVANTSTTIAAGATYSIYTSKITQAGTVSNDASGNLTGVGTSFNSDMIGQFIAYGPVASSGSGQIITVTDATHMKIDRVVNGTIQSGVTWSIWLPLTQPGTKLTAVMGESQIPLLMQGSISPLPYPGFVSQMVEGRPHVIPSKTFASAGGIASIPGVTMELTTSGGVKVTGSAPPSVHGIAFGPHCFVLFSGPANASNIDPVTGTTSTTFNFVSSPPVNGFVATIGYSLTPPVTGIASQTNNYTFSFNPNLGIGVWQNSQCVRLEH